MIEFKATLDVDRKRLVLTMESGIYTEYPMPEKKSDVPRVVRWLGEHLLLVLMDLNSLPD